MKVKSTVPAPANQSRWNNSRELLRQLIKREIAESIKGSALGVIWLVLNPLLAMALYVIVFGILFEGSFGIIPGETPINYATGVYIGLTIVNLINDSIARSTTNLHRQSNLIKKVVFPLELLPIVQVAGSSFTLLINCALWITMCLIFGINISLNILLVPVVLFPAILISLGISALFSAISVYLKDIQQFTSILTQIVFWSSGVFYSTQKVMEVPEIWMFLRWNPILLVTENIRAVALWGFQPDWTQIAFLYAFGFASLFLGYFFFIRLRRGFSDFL